MSQFEKTGNPGMEKIPEILASLENRIMHIEAHLGIEHAKSIESVSSNLHTENPLSDVSDISSQDGESFIESKIVEYGLGWFGSIVLLFGITFLMTFTHNKQYFLFSSLIGLASVTGIFIISYFLRRSFAHLVYMLNISGFLLLYYVILRMHFLSPNPIISYKGIAIALLLMAVSAQTYFAILRKSEFIASLGIVLILVTAVFSDETHIMLPLITLAAATSFLLFLRYAWWRLLIISILLVYSTHIFWLMNNPLMGHPLQAVGSHQFSLFYLFAYSAIFSMVNLVKLQESFPKNIYLSTVLLNGMSFSFILMLVVLTFFAENYIGLFIAISVFCLFFSIILQTQTTRPLTPSFYACYSFMALSVAVYGYAGLPDVYFYLVLQSLLVVSMALWFRSRIIVVINTLLFLLILTIYLITAPPTNLINFSFALIAIATARILNWQKERLTLKTEMLRNVYLFVAFIMILFSLYHSLPSQYITLSWTLSAALFFILSIFLHNTKYRWMAIFTILVTGVYLFIVDLAHMEVGYRIVAFLFFAVISFSASLYYTKRIKKKTLTDAEVGNSDETSVESE